MPIERNLSPESILLRRVARPLLLAAALLLAGCAATQMQAQWKDPRYAGKALQGKKALVVCSGRDYTLARICEDRFAAAAQANGLQVIRTPPPRNDPTAEPMNAGTLLSTAHAAGAEVVLAVQLQRGEGPDVVPAGPSVGVGVGGASGSRGGFGGVGIGITLPIGATAPGYALSANTTVTDVAADSLAWSGLAASPASQDVEQQITELARVTLEAIKAAGVL